MPPPLRFGKFVIEGLLGPGGVTETYLAREADKKADSRRPAKLFAVKLLRQDRVPKDAWTEVAARFLAAGRQLQGFHRPGLGKVIEVFEDPSTCFIASEHVAGRDLARLVETCREETGQGINPVFAGLICAEVARLLHVGHVAKPTLPHLGLSPTNVIVTDAGEVMLLDAGITAAVRGLTEQPPERWAFVAPELQGVDAGAPGLGDRRAQAADLYSLGLLLSFLVSGRFPQPASAEGKPGPAGNEVGLAEDVPAKLAAAVRTLLAFEPEDRPESALVLVEWLAEGIAGVKERQALIADGVRVAEMGRPPAPQVEPSEQAAELPPTIKLPGPWAKSGEGASGAGAGSRRGGGKRVLLLAFGLACAVAVAAAMWWRQPGRESGVAARSGAGKVEQKGEAETRRGPRERSAAQAASRNVEEMRPGEASGPAGAASVPRGAASEPTGAAEGEPALVRVAGHLIVETVPPGAMVWVDETLAGKSFLDVKVGDGGHRIVLIAPGHRMFRDVVDTGPGVIVRRTLAPIEPPTRGNGFIDVNCRTRGKYPVLLDEEETGLLCPAKMIPTRAGKHLVGIYVVPENRTLAVEITVEMGPKPALATFNE